MKTGLLSSDMVKVNAVIQTVTSLNTIVISDKPQPACV